MIRWDSKLKESWDIFVVLLVFVLPIEIPLRIALGYQPDRLLIILDVAISAIFAVDLVLQFFSEIRVKQKVIADRKQVALHYLKTWFVFDLAGTLPYDLLLMPFISPDGALWAWLPWLRLIRLLKAARISHMMIKFQRRHIFNPSVSRLVFFMVWMAYIAHWMACGWVLLRGEGGGHIDFELRYIRALYWTVTTLTTVGYGDITPVGRVQIVYTMVAMLLGVGFYGYIIGNISSALANIDVLKAQRKKKVEELDAFFKYRSIPKDLQERVHNYYEYIWSSRRGGEEGAILAELPFSLKTDIAMFLNRDILEKVPMFRGASEEFLRELVSQLNHVVATPGDYIFRFDQAGNQMYFISRGSVEVIAADGQFVLATLREGSFFGEMALLFNKRRTASVRACDYCDLYTLDRDTFNRVLERYPDFNDKIQEIVKARGKSQ